MVLIYIFLIYIYKDQWIIEYKIVYMSKVVRNLC